MSKIKVGNDEIELDEKILEVNIDTLNSFLSSYASWHRYYQNKYNDAAYIVKRYNDNYTSMLNSRFKEMKHLSNCSDKMAEASSKCDPAVLEIQEKLRTAEYVKDELWGFLRSMDYAHEDAMQICYNVRKEMSTIGGYVSKPSDKLSDSQMNKLSEIFDKHE